MKCSFGEALIQLSRLHRLGHVVCFSCSFNTNFKCQNVYLLPHRSHAIKNATMKRKSVSFTLSLSGLIYAWCIFKNNALNSLGNTPIMITTESVSLFFLRLWVGYFCVCCHDNLTQFSHLQCKCFLSSQLQKHHRKWPLTIQEFPLTKWHLNTHPTPSPWQPPLSLSNNMVTDCHNPSLPGQPMTQIIQKEVVGRQRATHSRLTVKKKMLTVYNFVNTVLLFFLLMTFGYEIQIPGKQPTKSM